MKKVFLISFLVYLAASAVFISGCRKEAKDLASYTPIGNTKNDSILVYNLLPDISNMNSEGYTIFLNDSLINFKGMTEYGSYTYGMPPSIAIPAQGGTFTIKVAEYAPPNPYTTPPILTGPPTKHPDPGAVKYQLTLKLPAHSGNSALVFYDSVGNIKSRFIPLTTVDPGAPAPGTYKMRVVNFGYSMYGTYSNPTYNGVGVPTNSAGQKYNIQMQYADSTVVSGMSNIPFGTVTPYIQISDYGNQQYLLQNLTSGYNGYLNNTGPLQDLLASFDMSQLPPYYGSYTGNRLFPDVAQYLSFYNTGTTEWTNIATYPFIAGGCYTVLIIGDIYVVTLDKRYGPGVLDDFAKVQVVNTDANQQNMEVKLSYQGGSQNIASLPFGKQTGMYTVPAGTVNISFVSGGQTLLTYTTQVPRLGNYTFYYCADLTNIPFVFPQNNIIGTTDYIPPSQYGPPSVQLTRLSTLDLCPDAGNVFYTVADTANFGIEGRLYAPNQQGDVSYKSYVSELNTDGTPAIAFDGTIPPHFFGLRYTTTRRDTLAGLTIVQLKKPFKKLQNPGSFTLVAAGLTNTTDPAKKPILILVQHTNFIEKTTK